MNGQCAIRGLALGLAAAFTTAAFGESTTELHSSAEEPDAATLADDAYTPPRFEDRQSPFYPRRHLKHRRPGWVQLDLQVDVEGKAREITVADSQGDISFEHAAIRALRRSTFEPARVDDEPVEASLTAVCEFSVEDADVVTNYQPPGDRQRVGSPSNELRWRRNFERAETGARSKPPRLMASHRKPSAWVARTDCWLK